MVLQSGVTSIKSSLAGARSISKASEKMTVGSKVSSKENSASQYTPGHQIVIGLREILVSVVVTVFSIVLELIISPVELCVVYVVVETTSLVTIVVVTTFVG
jgi:hypothetical protein